MNILVKKLLATTCCGMLVGLAIFGVNSNNAFFNNTSTAVKSSSASLNNNSKSVKSIASLKYTCDYPGYNSLEEMIDASNLIVDGSIISDNGISLIDAGAGEMQYRTYDIKVTKCIKGSAVEGDTIKIKVLASTDTLEITPEQGNEYIFFMESYDNGIPASLINMDQSIIGVNDNDLVVSNSDKKIIDKHFGNNSNTLAADKQNQNDKIYNFKDKLVNEIKNHQK